MKIDLTTRTWQDNPGCPINITLVSTSDVSILMEKVDKGGCFAAGPLTSQGLLHTMAALGLIPIKFANCGEVVKVPDFLSDIGKNNHCQRYLQSLALTLNISLAEAEQVTCKFRRSLSGSES